VRSELVHFTTSDGVELDGLVHRPEGRSSGLAALLVHGKTMNFYTGLGRLLPVPLAELGITSLAMNRRGHDLGGIRDSRASYGGAWERFADSQLDIAAGMAELRRLGFEQIVLLGHSFGGISAAQYAADHPEEIVALGLLSAGSGGPRYLEQSSRRGMLAADRHAELSAEAARLVAAGRGDQIIPLPGWWYAITAASWLDLEANVPSTVENAGRARCPILALRGALEPPEVYPAEAMASAAGERARLVVLEGSDHFYNDRQAELAEVVCGWLREVVVAARS
jgi:pimeloyl-ACP methyl ester carboxylesterase